MLKTVFAAAYSPIYRPDNLRSNLIVAREASSYCIGNVTMVASYLAGAHSCGGLILRVESQGKRFIYALGVKLQDPAMVNDFGALGKDCDLLISDTADRQEHVEMSASWKHPCIGVEHDVARLAARRVMGIHYDPWRTDEELRRAARTQQERFPGLTVELAKEGQKVFCDGCSAG